MGPYIAAALLAGGKSERMGFDKQCFHSRESRMFEKILPTLAKRFEDVMVVTNQPEIYRGMDVRPVRDVIPGLGPLSGIHAAISAAESEYVYILACDMPEINLDYIDYLEQNLSLSPADACAAKKGKLIEPFHAFYGKGALDAIEAELLAGKGSVRCLLQKINTLYIPEADARRFTPDWSLFRNLNTPGDYASWLESRKA